MSEQDDPFDAALRYVGGACEECKGEGTTFGGVNCPRFVCKACGGTGKRTDAAKDEGSIGDVTNLDG